MTCLASVTFTLLHNLASSAIQGDIRFFLAQKLTISKRCYVVTILFPLSFPHIYLFVWRWKVSISSLIFIYFHYLYKTLFTIHMPKTPEHTRIPCIQNFGNDGFMAPCASFVHFFPCECAELTVFIQHSCSHKQQTADALVAGTLCQPEQRSNSSLTDFLSPSSLSHNYSAQYLHTTGMKRIHSYLTLAVTKA